MKTVKIGDSVIGQIAVGRVYGDWSSICASLSTLAMQLGTMTLTWTPNPVPHDQAFDAIKAAIDALPAGVKLFINSGTFAI